MDLKRALLISGARWWLGAVALLAEFGVPAVWSAISTMVPADARWRYQDNGSNLGTNWVSIDFNDASWASGRAELGYGDGDEATTVDFGSNPNNKIITTYFRHGFVVTNAAQFSTLTLKVVRDDGVAVYLNGREVFRNNLPAGGISSSTLALTDIEGAAEFTFLSTNLSASLLNTGTNVLAAAIHQFSRSNSDISFALELTATEQSNQPPAVTLFSPTNGAAFFAPASITLAAAASDPNGPVSRVEFFEGTNLVGEATASPFNATWSSVPAGSYSLSAVAVDGAGARGTSAPVSVTVRSNLSPTVSVTAPTNNAIFAAPATISIAASAGDPDGSVSHVEFFDGDTLLGEDTSAPYTFAWTSLSAGNYQFSVIAIDDLGARSNPEVVDIVVRDNIAPQAWFESPTNGAIFFVPVDVVVRANASDADGTIAHFELSSGTNIVASGAGATLSLTLSNAPPGNYQFTARASDDLGTIGTASVEFIVRSNAAPRAQVLVPVEGQVFAAPADIPVLVEASDVDGAIVGLELWQGGSLLAQSSSGGLLFNWTNVAAGTYGLYAIAVDDAGARATSAVVNVTTRLPVITRGPYLQMGTETGMTVRWRTDLPTDSMVRYGTNAASLEWLQTNSTATTEHEVRLAGLSAGTSYSYAVGSTRHTLNAGGGTFTTSPGADKPMRIWVLGDSGTANDDARAVRDAYYAFNGTNQTDLWLMLGDNAYCCGEDSEYQLAVFDMYPETLKSVVLWPAIGNHDTYSADQQGHFAYLDIFTLPAAGEAGGVASGTENYYSFDYGNIHFVVLDSMTVDRGANSPMWTWLREDLAANTNHWLIAYWHHPPYTKGSHDSDFEIELVEMRENALPILESYGIDLVLAGHSHSYERSFLLNGHYGSSETLVPEMIKNGGDGRPEGAGAYLKHSPGPVANEGAVYVVAGSSGQVSWAEVNHPAMYISLLELGSLVLDVHGHVMDVKFLQNNGTIGDSFTLIKGVPTNVLQVTSLSLTNDLLTLTWNSIPGQSYYVERASSLIQPNWAVASSAIYATTSRTTWSQPARSTNTSTFYRIVQFKD